ncbi:MAG TPA: type II toxin-antitoxin system VapC family toxin [Rubrobacteraceae bacterium]|nr:type II toxin-antitoxin system VapC family toxin [Rubrobacteraceae bacterium]
MIVLDASAVVAVLLDPGPGAERIRGRIESPGESLHVPHLMDLEVLHALRRQALRGALSSVRGAEALEDLSNIVFVRYAHTSFIQRMWELRENFTVYDAAYVALAEALDAPLVTMDARLAQSPGIRAAVELY